MSDDSKRKINAPAWHAGRPYDEKERLRLQRACELIREHQGELAPGRRYDVLDVGCGVGPLRHWLGREAFRIVGLEISEAAAAIARERYDACEVCDVESPWPLAPAGFDAVHAGAVMEHVLDWHAPLNGANTALRDGGLLVVSVPNLRYWKEVRRLLRGRQPHWLKDMKHLHGYTPGFLCELVGVHGFEVRRLEADRVNLPLLPQTSRWACRRFARWGSVLILAARLVRRVRVEDHGRAAEFPNHREVACRSIEVTGE
jgi:SAM-dependent methyltransferase